MFGHMPLLCVHAKHPASFERERELFLFFVYVIFCSDTYTYIEEKSGCARHILAMDYFIKGTQGAHFITINILVIYVIKSVLIIISQDKHPEPSEVISFDRQIRRKKEVKFEIQTQSIPYKMLLLLDYHLNFLAK